MATCNWCNKKGMFLQLSKHKFCYECDGIVRDHVKSRLAQIKEISENTDASLDQIETAINLIDYLESIRHKVPYFKSDTVEYKKTLLTAKLAILKNMMAQYEAEHGINKDQEPAYEYDDVFIAFSDEVDTDDFEIGDELEIIREPDNEYDPNALAVFCNDEKIGYVPKKNFQKMIIDFWNRGDKVTAHIDKIADSKITMKLSFYHSNITNK